MRMDEDWFRTNVYEIKISSCFFSLQCTECGENEWRRIQNKDQMRIVMTIVRLNRIKGMSIDFWIEMTDWMRNAIKEIYNSSRKNCWDDWRSNRTEKINPKWNQWEWRHYVKRIENMTEGCRMNELDWRKHEWKKKKLQYQLRRIGKRIRRRIARLFQIQEGLVKLTDKTSQNQIFGAVGPTVKYHLTAAMAFYLPEFV